jgi:tetraacyldisaccharide 4'-kinase
MMKKLLLRIASHWYKNHLTWRTFCLLPLSWVFRIVVALRKIYYSGRHSYKAPVPVIVVGNITVGGTGKTPCVIWLAQFLKDQGFKPGIVSRGVGGKQQKMPREVTGASTAAEVGDEALLLVRRTQCPVVVGIDRVAAVKHLLTQTQTDIIISDDGLQHYPLARDIEIALVDGSRRFGNQQLLPAGPLREPVSRLKTVTFVLSRQAQKNEFAMQLQGDSLVSLAHANMQQALTTYTGRTVHAIAAIAHPENFFALLEQAGLCVIPHIFPDHHLLGSKDIVFNDLLPVIMTEKDAVKCFAWADDRYWFLPVALHMEEAFVRQLTERLVGLRMLKPKHKDV